MTQKFSRHWRLLESTSAEACRNSASYLGASVIVRQKLQTKKHQLQNSHCLQSLTLYRLAHQLGGIFLDSRSDLAHRVFQRDWQDEW